SLVSCAALLPCSFQGGARGPSALVLHHHLQRRQALHEEQAAGEGEIHTHTCLSPLTHTHICPSSHTHTHMSLLTHKHPRASSHTHTPVPQHTHTHTHTHARQLYP